ncbi:MAG: ATP-dependent helicase, partial [Candidatus Hadarchaeales archaeon]
ERILAITFTRKAASEMKERVLKLTGVESRWISTFHSFCLKVLREHLEELRIGLREGFTVYDEHDAFRLFQRICEWNHYGRDEAELFRKVSYLRQHGQIEEHMFGGDLQAYPIYRKYERALVEANAVDFDSIQLFALKLLSIPAVARIYREKFEHILIDELQDTSPVQYGILRRIARNGNITAVGDPQQSIYGFRGAVADNVLRFRKEYNPHIIRLEENFRSGQVILDVANTVSELIHERWRSLVLSLKARRTEGGSVRVEVLDSDSDEAEWIVRNVRFLLSELQPREIAVLVRSRFLKPPIKEALRASRIRFEDLDDYDLFQRAEVKDLLAYIRFALNPHDVVSLERAVSVPPRGVGEKTLESIKALKRTDLIQALEDYVAAARGKRALAVRDFVEVIRGIQKLERRPTDALDFLVERVGHRRYLESKYGDYGDRFSSILDLKILARDYPSLRTFLDDVLVVHCRKERNAVRIMTVHSAKGLEFDAVFVPGLERGVFPDEWCDFDEEIRCFYVAVTRARKYLFLRACHTRERFGGVFSSEPGPFFMRILDRYGETETKRIALQMFRAGFRPAL